MNRTDRLVAVLLELQARTEVRAEDLAAHFEVSVRTMYRDLEALSESGVPLVATPGKGYRLMEGYFLPPLAFTATEAALLMLGGEYIRQRVDAELHGPAEDALKKLTSVLPAEKKQAVDRWRQQLMFVRPRSTGTTDDARIAKLRAAIQERRVVRMRYHAFRRARAELREVEPFSLVFMGERWQVAGYCRLRQGPRMFRVDRIDDLAVQNERFTLDERHSAPRAPEDWKALAPEARVRVDPSIERWVRERQPFTLVREELDAHGPVFVYAMRDETDLMAWLLSWGAGIEVLEPPDLRRRVRDEAQRIAQKHDAGMDKANGARTVLAGLGTMAD